jgi:ribosome-binding protein aMBF1 (putative translation factor)
MKEKCPICNIEEELVEVVGEEEITFVCKRCAEHNHFPIINKPSQEQIRESIKFRGVKERLREAMPGKPEERKKTDKELEGIVVKNLKKKDYPDLKDNFHWEIQHARRMKKLSQKQLAEYLAESEVIISMAEKGVLPENYTKLISKLEQFFGMDLFKEKPKINPANFEIDKVNLSAITTDELKAMIKSDANKDNEVEEKILEGVEENMKKKSFWDFFKRKKNSEDEEEDEENDEEEPQKSI